MATQAQRRETTRTALLEACGELFAQRGFEGVSVDAICARANVAKGTFYQYFETKHDAVLALLRHELTAAAPQILGMVERGRPALVVLEQLLERMCRWLEEHPTLAGPLLLTALQQSSAESAHPSEMTSTAAMDTLLRRAQQRGEVRKDYDSRELAEMLGGVFASVVFAWAHSPRKRRLWPWFKRFLRLFLEGARPG